MDAEQNWSAFACTGNIYRYLDYKKQEGESLPANSDAALGEKPDGSVRNAGPCVKADTI